MEAVFSLASCPANAHDEPCACPASCQSPKPNCGLLCEPGCVCNSGFLFNDSQCINASSCNCFYNNNYYKVRPWNTKISCGRLRVEHSDSGSICSLSEVNLDQWDSPKGSVHKQWLHNGGVILSACGFDCHLCSYNKCLLSAPFHCA